MEEFLQEIHRLSQKQGRDGHRFVGGVIGLRKHFRELQVKSIARVQCTRGKVEITVPSLHTVPTLAMPTQNSSLALSFCLALVAPSAKRDLQVLFFDYYFYVLIRYVFSKFLFLFFILILLLQCYLFEVQGSWGTDSFAHSHRYSWPEENYNKAFGVWTFRIFGSDVSGHDNFIVVPQGIIQNNRSGRKDGPSS